jgi:GNAT superfamily N-acetyltransferase
LGLYIEQTWGWDEQWQREYHRKDYDPSRIQIVTLDGVDVGCVEFKRDSEQICLVDMFIRPEFQRQGIGSYLIRRLLAEGRDKGVPVRLGVLKVNPARKLYERLGFRVVGETETHYEMEARA